MSRRRKALEPADIGTLNAQRLRSSVASGNAREISTIRYSPGVTSRAPGSLVREARRRAGLSQKELGRRAGVTQSVVSAYESGARQPSLPTLERLVRAAGCELNIAVRGRRPHVQTLGGPVGQKL